MTDEVNEKLLEHFQVLEVSLFLCLAASYIAFKQGFFELTKIRHVPVKGKQVLLAFLAFIGFQILVVPALIVVGSVIFEGQRPNFALMSTEMKGWFNVFSLFGGAFGVLLAFLTLPKDQRLAIWGHSTNWLKDIMQGCLSWLVSYPFAMVLGQLTAILVLLFSGQFSVDQIAVREFKRIVAYPSLFTVTSLGIIFIVPCVEELLFRGYLQSWLKTKIKNTYIAIVVTSIVFALFHFSPAQKLTNIELAVSLFILSCFLGFLYEKKKSLWASIGLHASFNAVSVLMIIVDKS